MKRRAGTSFEGTLTLRCRADGCGLEIEVAMPVLPAGWRETDQGPCCPRHRTRTMIVDPEPEELIEAALLEDTRREQQIERAAREQRRQEREREAAGLLEVKRRRLAERLTAQDERERVLLARRELVGPQGRPREEEYSEALQSAAERRGRAAERRAGEDAS